MESTTGEFESVLFMAAYDSNDQRRLRLAALLLLLVKHGLRSILLAWPLYFIALIPFLIPVAAGWWVTLFIFPALLVSAYVAFMDANQEYKRYIRGKLLIRDNLASLLWDDVEKGCF